MLKMWDPDLRDTTEPLMCVDLKAFAVEGDPQLNARTAGRAMDWTTSEQFLRLHRHSCASPSCVSRAFQEPSDCLIVNLSDRLPCVLLAQLLQ